MRGSLLAFVGMASLLLVAPAHAYLDPGTGSYVFQMVAAALVSLVHVEMLAAWIAVVIIGRELAVTGLRGVALSMGTVVPASSLGKAKTVSQYVAITVLILEKGVSPDVEIFHLISRGVLWIALALTVISGVDYFYRFFLSTNPKDLVKDRERWP